MKYHYPCFLQGTKLNCEEKRCSQLCGSGMVYLAWVGRDMREGTVHHTFLLLQKEKWAPIFFTVDCQLQHVWA